MTRFPQERWAGIAVRAVPHQCWYATALFRPGQVFRSAGRAWQEKIEHRLMKTGIQHFGWFFSPITGCEE